MRRSLAFGVMDTPRLGALAAAGGMATDPRLHGRQGDDDASSAGSAGSSKRTRAERRARQAVARSVTEGKLAAALARVQALEDEVKQHERVMGGEPQVAKRLLAIAPCIEAQLSAAEVGQPHHTSRPGGCGYPHP